MDLLHGPDGRKKDILRLGPEERAGFLKIGLQGDALHKVHDDVGCCVFLKQVLHPDDSRNAVHLGHFSGFLQKHAHSVLLGLLCRLCGVPGQACISRGPTDLAGGVKFLDGNLPLQSHIPTNIGDAKAALAQDTAHQVFPGQDGAHGQGIFRALGLAGIKAAVGAGVGLDGLHAAKASV